MFQTKMTFNNKNKGNWFNKFNNNQMPNFNMAEIFLFRLNELLYKCSEARTLRDMFLWWTCLDELYNNIAFKFHSEDENVIKYKKDLDDLFLNVEKLFKNSNINNDVYAQSITESETILRLISRKLNIFLYEVGLLMPLQKVQRDITGIVEDF